MARKPKSTGKGRTPINNNQGQNRNPGESPDRMEDKKMDDENTGNGDDTNRDGEGEGTPDDKNTVGYKKPPKHTQFKKGQSGNPRGRCKGSRGLKTDLATVLSSIYTTTINREPVKGSMQLLMLKTLATRAAHGDVKASATLAQLTIQILGVEDRGKGKETLSASDQALLDEMLAGVPATPKAKVKPKSKRTAKPRAARKSATQRKSSGAAATSKGRGDATEA